MKINNFLSAAIFIAISFTFFACSSDGGGDGSGSGNGGNGSGGYSGSYGSVIHGGQTYKTVIIGTQTWFAENLNIDVEGSVCHANDDANCATYGRLYNWRTAMDLMPGSNGVSEETNCNSIICENYVSSKHQGICPSGWHIPSNEDWDKLSRYVDGDDGTSSPYTSSTAGKYLKATNGWNNSGNGEDKYGFAALPGGYGSSDGGFYYAVGLWWSASENNTYSAYRRSMDVNYEGVYTNYSSKSSLFSVRCVMD